MALQLASEAMSRGALWHAEGVENSEPQDVVLPLAWPSDDTPPSPANQHIVQMVQEVDGGPGELVVTMGYVLPPNLTPETVAALQQSGQGLPVSLTSRFLVSRRQAEALMASLQEVISRWDQLDAEARGTRRNE